MTSFGPRTCPATLILSVLLILPAHGDPLSSVPAASGPAASSPATATSRDHLLGWYELPRRQAGKVIPGPGTLIPVFKVDGAYYSVCKGTEVPLKECPEGLEWGLEPSSMVGTKIGIDEKSGAVYLAIVDARTQDDWYQPGLKQPMKKVDKPAGLLDAASAAPRTNDDFVGCYQPIWRPQLRYEIRKEGDKYVVALQFAREDTWTAVDKPAELVLLADRLGFVLGSGKKVPYLTYNKALKRFELETSGPGALPLRMPLARVPAPPPPQQDAVPLPKVRIGIPSW